MSETAIVSGAGSGIGAGVAQSLGARGAMVAVADRNGDAALATVATIERVGGMAYPFTTDVTDANAVDDLVQQVVARFGRPSVVVACAGVAATGRVTEMPLDMVDRIFSVNLLGVYLLARSTMPHLECGGGSFTAIASDAAVQGFQGYPAYCASKHGVIGLIKALALDHGPKGVRSNAVCPGYVETPMLDRLLAELPAGRDTLEQAVPLGRFARVDDVASAVAYLSSDAARYVNGAVISIDGGSSAGPFASQD